MKQDFSDITDEQLGRLYPIILTEHDPAWKAGYQTQKEFVEEMIGKENIVRISHYGSTSVPNLIAKPTIDILLEIIEGVDLESFIDKMVNNGCVYLEQPNNPPPHMMFLRGYTPQGFIGQAVHIHVRYSGDWDEMYFRDYLIAYPDVADRYGKLKLRLKEQYEHDRDGYTYAKTEFIKKHTVLARKEFGCRYSV